MYKQIAWFSYLFLFTIDCNATDSCKYIIRKDLDVCIEKKELEPNIHKPKTETPANPETPTPEPGPKEHKAKTQEPSIPERAKPESGSKGPPPNGVPPNGAPPKGPPPNGKTPNGAPPNGEPPQTTSVSSCINTTVCHERHYNIAVITYFPFSSGIEKQVENMINDCCGRSCTSTNKTTLADVTKIQHREENSPDMVFPVLGRSHVTKLHGYWYLPLFDAPVAKYVGRSKLIVPLRSFCVYPYIALFLPIAKLLLLHVFHFIRKLVIFLAR